MRDIIKKVPIPTAGVALGLAALGNLLQPYAEVAHIICGALSLFLVAMIVAKGTPNCVIKYCMLLA